MENIQDFKQHNREWKQKASTAKTLSNFLLHYIDAYEELLEDFEKEGKIEEKQANNLITSQIINKIIHKEEKEEQEQHTNLAKENENIMDMMKTMMEKITALESNKTNKKQEKGKLAWSIEPPKEGEPTEKSPRKIL